MCRLFVCSVLTAMLFAATAKNTMADVKSSYNEDIRQVFLLERKGSVQEAIALWKSKERQYSGFSDGRYEDELGKLYARHGDYVAAEKSFRSGLDKSTKYSGACYSLFILLFQTDRLGEADKLVEYGFGKFGQWPEGHLARAQLALKNGEYEKSITEAKEALKYAEYLPAIYSVAYANFKLKRYIASVEAYGTLLEKEPAFYRDRDGMVVYAISLANIHQYKEAIDALKHLEENGAMDDELAKLRSEIESAMQGVARR